MFHIEGDLFLERKENGDVMIVKKDPKDEDGYENIIFQQLIPNDIWCSVICNASLLNEEHYRWYLAKEFHNGTNPDNIKIIKEN